MTNVHTCTHTKPYSGSGRYDFACTHAHAHTTYFTLTHCMCTCTYNPACGIMCVLILFFSILSGCYDNKVYNWHGDEQLAVMEGHSQPVTDLQWINDVLFLFASQDQGIVLWKVRTRTLPMRKSTVSLILGVKVIIHVHLKHCSIIMHIVKSQWV